MQGKIRNWDQRRAFGFIECPESRNVFIHFSEIKNRGPDQIQVGDSVEFSMGADREGRLCGKNARVIERPTTDCNSMRYGDIGVEVDGNV